MPNGLAEPAMKPIHPDKPEPPIVAGDVWIKKASGKTSVNAPRCRIISSYKTRGGAVWVHVRIIRGGTDSEVKTISERVFRRDWRPC